MGRAARTNYRADSAKVSRAGPEDAAPLLGAHLKTRERSMMMLCTRGLCPALRSRAYGWEGPYGDPETRR